MKALARHLLLELYDCDREALNNMELLKDSLKAAARAAGATVVSDSFYQFNPYGVSGVVVIAESHLSIHTWPEYGYAAVDIFTCGTSIEPEKAAALVTETLHAGRTECQEIKRGVLPRVPDSYPKQKAGVS